MTPPRPFKPMIVGVHPRVPSLYADERRVIYRKAVVQIIISYSKNLLLDNGSKIESEKLPELDSIISTMIEGHLIDLAWMDSVNPADSVEISTLRKDITSLLSRLNGISDSGRTIINYDWKSRDLSHGDSSLISRTTFELNKIKSRIDSILKARTQQGRPKKDNVSRLCNHGARIWEVVFERRFPISLRIHDDKAADQSFDFVLRIVQIFKPDVKLAEVRYQLKKVARTKKTVRAAD